MPQLDPSIIASQIFWSVLTFLALCVLMARFTLPRIEQVLDERQDRIDNDIDKATTLKAEAEQVMEEYNAVLAEAHQKYREMVESTQAELKAMALEKHSALSKKLSEESAKAEARIQAAKSKAMEDVKSVARDVAADITKKLTGMTVEAKQASSVVDRLTNRKKAA